MVRRAVADAIDNFLRDAVRVACGFHEGRGNGADEDRFGDLALAMPRHIARHLTPSRRMPDMDGILEAEFLNDLSGVIGVGVHVMALRRLGRAAVAAPVVGNHAIAVIEEKHHLGVPVVGR